MSETKKSMRSIIYTLVLVVAMIILFHWYTTANNERIENQNMNYATDSARQTAEHMETELENGLSRITTYAYFLGESLDEPVVTPDMLGEMSENSLFNYFRFADASGINYSDDGQSHDVREREYYIKGMNGETGISAVLNSDFNHRIMINFYTPLYYNGEIIGVLQGAYLPSERLQSMLHTSYFGVEAGVYLCVEAGDVIASTEEGGHTGNIFESMLSPETIGQETYDDVKNVFENGGEYSFFCDAEDLADNICVIKIPDTEYVLVQTFPKSVTRTMINNANRTGIIMEVILITLFVAYMILILVRSRFIRKRLQAENREMGYVIAGSNLLFSRFVMADFENDTYQYLSGTRPEAESFPLRGKYEAFVDYLCSFLIDEDEKQQLSENFSKENVIETLGEDRSDIRYELHVAKKGKECWEHMSIIPLERKNGKVVKVLVLRQDITEIKEKELRAQAKIALAGRRERQYIVATMSDAICTYEFNLTRDIIESDIIREKDGEKISLLKKAGLEAPCKVSEWFEARKSMVESESLSEYSAVNSVEFLRECFEKGEVEEIVEYWTQDIEGEKLCVRQSFIMTRDESGDIMVMAIIKDITEQVKKQQEQMKALQEALLQAQHANNAKTTFLSNMSHDIRTPMNAIIGFTTIAVSHIDNKEQVKDCLQKVLSSSNHLLSLINDILDMSRIESGKVQIKEQACNISEITHSLINIIQPQVKAKQLELFIDTFDVANEDVIADPLKLNQIFINLMSNAVKYTPAGGTVSFRIIQETTFHRGYGDYTFIVKDNGIGMSQDFVEHIFEPFEREASATKSGIQGTGLGMAITKNIVEMMGGKISVTSEKGKGSEFRVELSLKLQDVEKNAEQIKELEGLRALVVDDDFDTCDSVSKMLNQIGLRAEWTTSGREAVYRAKSAHEEGDSYHTYILDWQMPEMSGVETARRIRAAVGDEAPIIILTAYDWSDIEEEARAAGISAFCAKPLFMSDLRSVLLTANQLTEQEDEEEAAWMTVDFSGKRVLLVEDNELNREIAEEILEEAGFEVDAAPDGTDAVAMMQRVEENYYDVILMDVQMPIMDGYEATRNIRALPREDVKNIPIIAMTANAMDEDKEAALKSGMNAHIAKPINMDVFMAILSKYLK